MTQYYLPILIVISLNTMYHICAKAMPSNANPLALLVFTYLIAAALALIMFFITDANRDFIGEFKQMTWAPLVLGFCVLGLEFGFILMYRVGWDISLGSLVCNIALAMVLILIGYLFYKEQINMRQIVGIVLCVTGLVFINK